MKRYSDILDFFDSIQPETRLNSLPRSGDETAFATEPLYKKAVQSQLDCLLGYHDILCYPNVMTFFQMSDVYRAGRPDGTVITTEAPISYDQRDVSMISDVFSKVTGGAPGGAGVPSTWPGEAPGRQDAKPVSLLWDMPDPSLGASAAARPASDTWGMGWSGVNANPGRPNTQPLAMGWSAVPDVPRTASAGQSAQLCWEMPSASQSFLLQSKAGASTIPPGGDFTGQPQSAMASKASPASPAPPALREKGSSPTKDKTVILPVTDPNLTQSSASQNPIGGSLRSELTSKGSSMYSSSRSSTGGSRPWCVICMAKPEEVAVDPCGHLSMCADCAALVKQCPVCRGPIESLLRVYIVK